MRTSDFYIGCIESIRMTASNPKNEYPGLVYRLNYELTEDICHTLPSRVHYGESFVSQYFVKEKIYKEV